MTSQILPFGGALTPPGTPRHESSMEDITNDQAAFAAELAASDHVLAHGVPGVLDDGGGAVVDGGAHGGVDGGTPPPEVLDQIAVAGRICRELRETGHQLRFSEGSGGRVTVELSDREGNTVKSMLVSEALEIAAGKPLG
jgi:hypothetical protein